VNCFEVFFFLLFQLLGYDFMLDENLNLFLIEANTNPCFETQSCSLLATIIPNVVDQAIRLAIDPLANPKE